MKLILCLKKCTNLIYFYKLNFNKYLFNIKKIFQLLKKRDLGLKNEIKDLKIYIIIFQKNPLNLNYYFRQLIL